MGRHDVRVAVPVRSRGACRGWGAAMCFVPDDSLPQASTGPRRGARAQQAVCHSLCYCVCDCGLPVACLPSLRSSMALPSPQPLDKDVAM